MTPQPPRQRAPGRVLLRNGAPWEPSAHLHAHGLHPVVVVAGGIERQLLGLGCAAAAARTHADLERATLRGIERQLKVSPREATVVAAKRRLAPALATIDRDFHRCDTRARVPGLAGQ